MANRNGSLDPEVNEDDAQEVIAEIVEEPVEDYLTEADIAKQANERATKLANDAHNWPDVEGDQYQEFMVRRPDED